MFLPFYYNVYLSDLLNLGCLYSSTEISYVFVATFNLFEVILFVLYLLICL